LFDFGQIIDDDVGAEVGGFDERGIGPDDVLPGWSQVGGALMTAGV